LGGMLANCEHSGSRLQQLRPSSDNRGRIGTSEFFGNVGNASARIPLWA
jgi:hypothetical protein